MIETPLFVAAKPELFVSPWPAELVPDMHAKQYLSGPERAFTRIAHVKVPNCQPGDILSCKAYFQASNALGYNVELAACLVLTPYVNGVAGMHQLSSLSNADEPPDGKFITRFPGFNVTPNSCTKFPHGGMHHAYYPLVADYLVPEGVSGDQWVAIVAYAGGILTSTNERMKVDGYCSSVSVLRFR